MSRESPSPIGLPLSPRASYGLLLLRSCRSARILADNNWHPGRWLAEPEDESGVGGTESHTANNLHTGHLGSMFPSAAHKGFTFARPRLNRPVLSAVPSRESAAETCATFFFFFAPLPRRCQPPGMPPPTISGLRIIHVGRRAGGHHRQKIFATAAPPPPSQLPPVTPPRAFSPAHHHRPLHRRRGISSISSRGTDAMAGEITHETIQGMCLFSRTSVYGGVFCGASLWTV